MNRRFFTTILGKGLALWVISPFVLGCSKKSSGESSWQPEELANICGKEELISVGLKYRELSGEDNRDTLISLLSKNFSGHGGDQKKYIRGMVSDDFRTNQTILIDGWLLSRTEARLCAVLSLSTK